MSKRRPLADRVLPALDKIAQQDEQKYGTGMKSRALALALRRKDGPLLSPDESRCLKDSQRDRLEVALALADAASASRRPGGRERAARKLTARERRLDLIRKKFKGRARDRAACRRLRSEVESFLLHVGEVPSLNTSRQIDEIVEALVT
jgi:hypothetical protein